MRVRRFIDGILADVRYSARQMKRSPILTIVAVCVLAIGVGVNAWLIAFVDGFLAPSAPGVPERDRVMSVGIYYGDASKPFEQDRLGNTLQLAELDELAGKQQVFSAIGGSIGKQVLAGTGGTQDYANASFVTGRYFDVLRPRMALGRPLESVDDRVAVPDPTAVLSYRYWQMHFGGDSSAVGATVFVQGVPLRVVGVLPARFDEDGSFGISPYDLWMPLATRNLFFADSVFFRRLRGGGYFGATIIARLRDGVSAVQAAVSIRGLPPLTAAPRHPRFVNYRTAARLLYEVPPDLQRQVLEIGGRLSVITFLILAVACANVSILLLGRAVARRREIAVRLSLGAPRLRVIRQLATEGAVLAFLAGLGGVLLLQWFALAAKPWLVTRGLEVSVSPRAAAFSVAFAICTCLLFALVPAFHATKASVGDALKDATAGVGRRRARLQRGFVIAEVALSVALVCTAGLFVTATNALVGSDRGYEVSRQIIVSNLALDSNSFPASRADQLLNDVRFRLQQVPGVETVAFTTSFPEGFPGVSAYVETDRVEPVLPGLPTRVGLIDGDYFGAVGARVVRGPGFNDFGAGGPPAAIVSDELARFLWGNDDPLGKTLRFARDSSGLSTSEQLPLSLHSFVVVGVAAAAGYPGRVDRRFDVYIPRAQVRVDSDVILVVRLRSAVSVPVARIIEAIHAADRDLAFSQPTSTHQQIADDPDDLATVGTAASVAASVILAMAAVGLFAVVGFAVAQRKREIGIRLALGATRERVVWSFFDEGMRLALIGFAIGLPVAIAATRLFQSQLEQLQGLAVAPVLSVVAILLTVAAFASWLPARRAALVDPVDSLRSE